MISPVNVRLDIPADIHYLGIITASLNELILAQPHIADAELLSHNIQLAVHEVSMNIIEHAYADLPGGRIALTLTIEPCADRSARRLIVELADTGPHSFDPAAIVAPNLDEPQVGGYGLFLARQLLDEVYYEARANEHYWRLTKNLE